jgi:hypothetical protein
MSEQISDFNLAVTVRLYGNGTAEDAARALLAPGTYLLPNGAEVEILDARAVTEDSGDE